MLSRIFRPNLRVGVIAISIFAIIGLVGLTMPMNAFGFNVTTHWHFNNAINSDPYFTANSMGPDMFTFSTPEISNAVHAPVPLIKPNDVNFGYLMLWAQGYEFSGQTDPQSLGWGGHIAADWVSHNKNFAPIGKNWIEDSQHIHKELLYSMYVLLTRLAATPLYKFNTDQIRRTYGNYQSLSLAKNFNLSNANGERDLRDAALFNVYRDMRANDVLDRSRAVVAAAYTEEALITTALAKDPTYAAKLLLWMNFVAGAEKNIGLAKEQIAEWTKKPSTLAWPGSQLLEHVESETRPFPALIYPLPTGMSSNQSTSMDKFNDSIALIKDMFSGQKAYAEPLDENIEGSTTGGDTVLVDIADEAQTREAIRINQQITTDPKGDQVVTFTPQMLNKDLFDEVVTETIEEHINNPASEEDLSIALLWRNVYVDAAFDPPKLLDSTNPEISDLTPAPGFVTAERSFPVSAKVKDNEGGIGVDPELISLSIDNQKVNHQYNAETGQVSYLPPEPFAPGSHKVDIEARDKAGNKAEATTSFTILAAPPKTTLNVEPASPNGNNNWYTTVPAVKLQATSEVEGVSITTYYRIDEGEELIYQPGSTVQIPAGTHMLYYRSVDEFNNAEEVQKTSFSIDTSGPVINATAPSGNYILNQLADFYYDATDDYSGVSKVEAKLNGQAIWPGILFLTQLGGNNIEIISEDNAGNKSVQNYYFNVGYKVDWQPPIRYLDDFSWYEYTMVDGSTVPIKWTLRDAFGVVMEDQTQILKVTSRENVANSAVFSFGDGSDSIRYDSETGQYIVNLQTKNYPWITPSLTDTYAIELWGGISSSYLGNLFDPVNIQVIEGGKTKKAK